MAYPPEFLKLVDQFIHLANQLAEGGKGGEVSAAILFAAGRYNAFNFLSGGGTEQDRAEALEFYVSEYRKALDSNLDGAVGPVVKTQG
jgi:TPR repeat protein